MTMILSRTHHTVRARTHTRARALWARALPAPAQTAAGGAVVLFDGRLLQLHIVQPHAPLTLAA
jgi:hypothetical protein